MKELYILIYMGTRKKNLVLFMDVKITQIHLRADSFLICFHRKDTISIITTVTLIHLNLGKEHLESIFGNN